jgi:hypothetical protein
MTSSSNIAVVRRRRMPSRALAWLPLAGILVLVAASLLTGRAPLPVAHGAVVVNVTGSVATDISIDVSACLPPSLAIGDILPGVDPWKTAQANGGGTCAISFGTTNVTQGVNLDVLEDPGAPATPANALKCVGGGCSGGSLDDYDAPGIPAIGTSAFGSQLLGSGGIASALWSPAPAVHGIPDAGVTACRTSTVGIGTCTFTFGASAAATDTPGSYEAQVRYVVLAR